jgi:hypothetical protein
MGSTFGFASSSSRVPKLTKPNKGHELPLTKPLVERWWWPVEPVVVIITVIKTRAGFCSVSGDNSYNSIFFYGSSTFMKMDVGGGVFHICKT